MHTHPTVTAAITTHNRAHALRGCVEAILNQSSPVQRILIVDDGSTDNTVDVIEQLKAASPIPLTLIHQQNSGVSTARNAAMNACDTDFIAFCDDDDIWWHEHVHAFREAHSLLGDINVFAGHAARSSFDGPAIRPNDTMFSEYRAIANSSLLVREQGPLQRPFFTPSFSTSIFRTELVRAHPLNSRLRAREDIAFFWLISEHANIFLDTRIHIIAQQFDTSLLSTGKRASPDEVLRMNLQRSYWSVRMLEYVTQGRKTSDSPLLFRELGNTLISHGYYSALSGRHRDAWRSLNRSMRFTISLSQIKLLARLLSPKNPWLARQDSP